MSKFDNGLFVIDFILNKLKILLYFNLKSKIYSLREKVKYINVALLLYSCVISKCCQQQFNITQLYIEN